MKNGYKYTLKALRFERDNKCEIPETHLKSAYVALINSGTIKPSDLEISKLRFEHEKLT